MMLKRNLRKLLLLAAVGLNTRVCVGANGPAPGTSPVVPYLTAEEEAKTFELKPGYRMELVVGDPIIKEPVLAVFDGNGRMYVAEMRTYMQNIDGRDELTTNSRISLHWSSKGDGVFDRHTVFADNLVLPRMILPLAAGVLVNETGSDTIWHFSDSKGDGVADQRHLFVKGNARGENLEHQPSGLIWGLDNWMYMAVNPYRLRIRGNNVVGESTPPNYGQWGLTQDDYGKTYFVNAGYEAGPVSYQTPIIYGGFEIDGKYPASFAEVWPLVGTADYEGGLSRVRPGDKTLNHFTGTCGPDVFRGDRLPRDLRGDLLFAEPVGRLIRRAKIQDKQGFTVLTNPYEAEHSEFIRSSDPNFRPVNMVTAPDGTLYIVDMYRGVIQEGNWVGPGSYLRTKVQELQLDKNIGRGRIWRLVHQDFKPGPQPHLLDETPAQLVAHLDHPNGWWRSTAQKLLVLGGDKSVAPALVKMARSDTNQLARIHAIWTLEGLDALEPSLVREKLADPQPQVRIAAMRASESLYLAGDHSLVPDLLELAADRDPDVVLQVLLTATYLKLPEAGSLTASTIAADPALGIQKIGPLLIAGATPPDVAPEFTAEDRALLARGERAYKQICFACHGLDGRGTPLTTGAPGATLAPSLSGAKLAIGHCEAAINAVLKGLTGPLDGRTFTAQMVPMEGNNDEWIAAVVSYVRNNFGNTASMVSTNDVARVRAVFKDRLTPWTVDELNAVTPQPLANRASWKVSASHNSEAARLAIDGDAKTRFDTHVAQAPGMWFQIQLPSPATIAGLELDAGAARQDFPRGYRVELSDDGAKWTEVAEGHGTGAQTEIVFAPAKTKYIRIDQTADSPGHFWSIGELQVIQPKPLLLKAAGQQKAATSIYQ